MSMCSIGLDGLYHQQTEGNEHKLGSCLVEFFSRPPSAGRRLRGRIRAVDEEGGAKRSGSVLDLLANAAAQTG